MEKYRCVNPFSVTKYDYCNGCKDYISVGSDKGVELLDEYESEVEEVLKPLEDKWRQIKEQKNE